MASFYKHGGSGAMWACLAADTGPWAPGPHLLGAAVAVEKDGCGALVHLVAGVTPGVVHFQQAVLVSQLLSQETCSRSS